jgi:hypothetical protein
MCTSVRTLLVAASIYAVIGSSWEPALACSVCLAGDPSFSSSGATAQQAGDISVYFEVRGWEKQSGSLPHADVVPHEHEGSEEDPAEGDSEAVEAEHEHASDEGREDNSSQRLDLYLSWTPIDRATFTLDLPWAFNAVTEKEGELRTRSTLAGLGDVSLLASVVAWRNRDTLPSTWLELRAFGKAPTGEDDEEVDGTRDPHLQPGTGSWDYGLGAAVAHLFEWGAMYGSLFQRWNQRGSLDYQYGDALLANFAIEAPLGHALGRPALDMLIPGFELNFRYAGFDQQDGENWADSGGSILYATPSLRVRLPAFGDDRHAWLRAAVQIPTTNAWLHGEQTEDPLWSIGVGVGF